MNQAFPNASFPLGAIHEFIMPTPVESAASNGFIAGLLKSIMQGKGVCVWIGQKLYPPALSYFGIEAHRFLFIELHNEKDRLWAMEEALKCPSLAAVVGELKELSFTASRRLQLLVEQSLVTGFVMRTDPGKLQTTASVARWKISTLSSQTADGLPGIGEPAWKVELLKIRNGKPGHWQVRWEYDKLRVLPDHAVPVQEPQTKTA